MLNGDCESIMRALCPNTRKYLPWALVYYESFHSLEDAKKREKALKYFGKAYAQLKSRIMNSLKGAG